MDLSKVRTVVTHANCPDGIASALIVRDSLPDVRVVSIAYDRERDTLPAEPGLLFVDMSPPDSRAQEFVDAGAIVLDHHKTTRDVVAMFGENGRFGDEAVEAGVCGAVLAFRHVWEPDTDHRANCILTYSDAGDFATLAGIRDTWQRTDPRWQDACEQAEYLRFLGIDKALEMGLAKVIAGQGWLAPHLFARKMAAAKRAATECFRCTLGSGVTLAIVSGVEVVSDVAEMIDADIIAGFWYQAGHRPTLHISLRSRGTVDVGALAKRLGGGGHTSAAGFRIDWESEHSSVDPFMAICHSLNRWVSK